MAGDVPVVQGVRWGAVEAGIRKRGGLDLGLVLCTWPAASAAVFTQCEAAAAPVLLSKARVRRGKTAAILVNAGCANACTSDGMEVAEESTAAVADVAGCKENQVLVASTGVIGQRLPAHKIVEAMPALVGDASEDGLDRFARAIMTTDTFPKVSGRSFGKATVAGCSKGAGMIMPNMATMLGFLATDAHVPPADLRLLLKAVAHDTFNAITVDGDTSTNDSLFLLATGASGVVAETGSRTFKQLEKALREVCTDLATSIARDGEGATKLIKVRVEGARHERDADAVARRIANSPLVKTAMHAADANWGRIVAAAGTAGVRFDADKLEVRIGPAVMCKRGVATAPENEVEATRHLQGREVEVLVKLGAGKAARTIWTCDFSAAYVKINAEYRT
ncbi:bifunctional glutamate N-acetyltransferase/amino-acid acetyltransferase ArgJ [Vulgatibacter sp.]|uniref:bifunctional glutamate N-acetyltransferase/amino-acid acetyltransferase ArgJ n=1 Tax=Vulgatibacter sp. TaxID=1971226 RepID=UPI0035661B5E